MKNSLLNYQFFKSYRLPLEHKNKVFADVKSKLHSTSSKRIFIDDINLSGLNFSTSEKYYIGEEIEISVYTNKLINNWDFNLKGRIVRSFIDEDDSSKVVYGALIENQNMDSVLNYFLKDFIGQYSFEDLLENIKYASTLDKSIGDGENVELFSLFNSVVTDLENSSIDLFLNDLNSSFRCENYHVLLFDHVKNRLVNYRSSTNEDILKKDLRSTVYMIYNNAMTVNYNYDEKNKKDLKIYTLLGHPLFNKNGDVVGVIILTNTRDKKSFSTFFQQAITLASQIISYHLKDFASNINFEKHNEHLAVDLFLGTSRTSVDLKNCADNLKNTSKNIFILGEKGLNSLELAKYIHLTGKYNKEVFKVLEFQNKEKIAEFFENIQSFELSSQGTIVLNGIENLNKDQQIKFYDFIKNQKMRIISLSTKELYFHVKKGNFSKKLYYFLSEVYIHLPTLRNRKNEILEIADLMIHGECVKKGIEIKELSPEAQRDLLKYNWPGNLAELRGEIKKSIIRNLKSPQLQLNIEIKQDGQEIQSNKFLFKVIKSMVNHSDKSIDFETHRETLRYYLKSKKVS